MAKGQKITRYAYLLARGAIGSGSSTINADGSVQIHFELHDRGRSASLDEKMLVDGVAAWENPAERLEAAPAHELALLPEGKAFTNGAAH
jgi:hypothetical protein